jgi:hypothetical protein
LLQGFGSLPVCLLELLEEPRVLNGDDRLIREALQQGDLLLGERSYLQAPERDAADCHAIAHQWGGQECAMARLDAGGRDCKWVLVR